MRFILMGMLLLSAGGCVITDREALYYTRADIDAINARSECRWIARNMLQIARCDGR